MKHLFFNMKMGSEMTFKNPVDGELGFRLMHFEDVKHFKETQRLPFFSIILVSEGDGVLKVDFTDYQISKRAILFFSPYQPFTIEGATLNGVMINFHPDFFCIFRHQNEVASDGILFNHPNNPPFFIIPESESSAICGIIEHIAGEMSNARLAQHDILIAYLKILLIRAIRIKFLKETTILPFDDGPSDAVLLRRLIRMIELHYRSKHSGGEYAELLNIPAKKLGRIVKNHFQRTLTEIIAERIIMEAKRELNFTSRTLREIGYDLGFADEYHFSRYFKNKMKVSPQSFRDLLKNSYRVSMTESLLQDA